MPCIIVGFYWLAKDICNVNEKNRGIFVKKNGGKELMGWIRLVRGNTTFCPFPCFELFITCYIKASSYLLFLI
ncbi:hypothetical protein FLL85_04850 [Vibrio cholerae]|uniref:Uncharacterized protein n=1 Tax=Vibrio cholerae TaxID=666 RepID=A0A544C4Q6_VIBCL|nr:hypothetical protein FLM02_10730 [Vibrio cholerae]TQQ26201.1 hypothetical protein FLL85_04850 [Vibrio cholerae]